MDARKAIEAYKAWYIAEYKHRPSDRLIEDGVECRDDLDGIKGYIDALLGGKDDV